MSLFSPSDQSLLDCDVAPLVLPLLSMATRRTFLHGALVILSGLSGFLAIRSWRAAGRSISPKLAGIRDALTGTFPSYLSFDSQELAHALELDELDSTERLLLERLNRISPRPRDARVLFLQAIEEDFAHGETINVGGAILSRTEVLAHAALTELIRSGA